jgi:type IV secretory pathway VirB4 component
LVALELRRLVEGDLAGMFDGPTSSGLRVDAPVVALDLSAVFASPALALLMTCATGWLQTILSVPGGPKRLVVVDEAWAVLHDLATARWLQATFKLARSLGVANIAVVHRLSDLRAAGAAGSAQERLAEGLLADAETRVLFGQPPAEADASAQLLHLTNREKDLIAGLPRGVAVWKVGQRSFLVEHKVGPLEVDLVDTDAAMRDDPRRG